MSVKAFVASGVSRVVVVVNESYRHLFSQALQDFEKQVIIVTGGDTRADSVRAGLGVLTELDSSALIAVHDAARCFCTTRLIQECFESAAEHGAVTAAVPAVDTVVISREAEIASDRYSQEIESSLPRERVWQVQTPQIFRAELLREAHQRAITDRLTVPTDDASLVRQFHPVRLVIGERNNFKITTPDDYQVALTMVTGIATAAGNCA
jgi:2-C-methyl-D-erythritol 4-phosphate cytidylyltransferase